MKKLIVASLTTTLFLAAMAHGAAAGERLTKHHYRISERVRNSHAFVPFYDPSDEDVARYDGALGSGLVGH